MGPFFRLSASEWSTTKFNLCSLGEKSFVKQTDPRGKFSVERLFFLQQKQESEIKRFRVPGMLGGSLVCVAMSGRHRSFVSINSVWHRRIEAMTTWGKGMNSLIEWLKDICFGTKFSRFVTLFVHRFGPKAPRNSANSCAVSVSERIF